MWLIELNGIRSSLLVTGLPKAGPVDPWVRQVSLQALSQNLLYHVFYPDREPGTVFLFVGKVIQCNRSI